MSLAPEKVAELLFKFQRNELSESERKDLDQWRAESSEHERIFAELNDPKHIRESIREMHQYKEMVWDKVVKKAPELVRIPARRINWLWPAAAAALLILGIGIFRLLYPVSKKENISITATVTPANDIAPGTNKATLMLASGEKIILADTKDGKITDQGKTEIKKLDSSSVAYSPSSKEEGGNEAVYNVLQTPRGGQFRIILPDGTRVWLNAASSLKFPTAFNERVRKIELTGEAYFEVAKDKSKPFIVMLTTAFFREDGKAGSPTEIKVLGTHFNVNAYADENEIKTTLLEGIVEVSKASVSRVIKPGEQAGINRDNSSTIHVIRAIDTEDVVAWKNGRTFFKEAGIKTIMRMISRWYDVDVVYEGNIPDRNITGGISRNANLSELLKVLELNKIHFTIEGKKITVTP